MSDKRLRITSLEDIVFLFYLIPLIVPFAYTLILWASRGLSGGITEELYLIVTREPTIFLAGVVSICLAVSLDVLSSPKDGRSKTLELNRSRMLKLAYSVIILGILGSWNAVGYSSEIHRIVQLWIGGRYPLIYPLAILFAYVLLSPKLKLTARLNLKLVESLAPILLLISPLLMFLCVRIGFEWLHSLIIASIIFIAGIILTFRSAFFKEISKKE